LPCTEPDQGVQNLSLLPLKAIVMHFGSEAGHSTADLQRSVHWYFGASPRQSALTQSFSPVQLSPSLPVPRAPFTQQGTVSSAVPRFSQRSAASGQSKLEKHSVAGISLQLITGMGALPPAPPCPVAVVELAEAVEVAAVVELLVPVASEPPAPVVPPLLVPLIDVPPQAPTVSMPRKVK